jgi:hypothetical protein
MNWPRPGLIDLGIATVVAVAVLLPTREMYAWPAVPGDDAQQFALALAEARTIARPGDGLAVEDLGRRLGEANQKDWAVEATGRASARSMKVEVAKMVEWMAAPPAKSDDAPDACKHGEWRELLATSVAYVDRLDAKEALGYADCALAACEESRVRADANACPSPDLIRMQFYQSSLDAGVKSGKDPHHDPIGFRNAGMAGLRQIRIMGPPTETPSSHGSGGSGGSAH